MSEKVERNKAKEIDVLFGRELDLKGQFKDRLIHQHLKRDRKNKKRDAKCCKRT